MEYPIYLINFILILSKNEQTFWYTRKKKKSKSKNVTTISLNVLILKVHGVWIN